MKKYYLLSWLMIFTLIGVAAEAQNEYLLLADTVKKGPKADTVKKEKPKKKKDLPLEVGRTVPIKTNEGTWMSLDVSPDGRTIAFDFLGDIFTMPIAGGKPKQFTKGMAFDSHPKFSPRWNKTFIHHRPQWWRKYLVVRD